MPGVRLGHVPALDAVRGIAILLVLGVHAGRLLPGGVLGVDLFFVLSGFLITSLLLGEWADTGRIAFGAFYRRRALRLLPALGAMLAVLTTAAWIGLDDLRTELVWATLSLGYVVNIAALQAGGIGADNLQHMWSLSQEEQFYLVWPVLLLLLLRARLRAWTLALTLCAAALGLLAYRAVLLTSDASSSYLWYSPDTRSVGLVLGCLAGVLFSYGLIRHVPSWLATAMLIAGIAVVSMLDIDSGSHAVSLLPLFCVAATVVVLAAVLDPGWWFTRLIDVRWLRGLGRISYGLYLWHWPLFFAFGWMLGIPLALGAALVSYRFVEQPFLRRRHANRHPHADGPEAARRAGQLSTA